MWEKKLKGVPDDLVLHQLSNKRGADSIYYLAANNIYNTFDKTSKEIEQKGYSLYTKFHKKNHLETVKNWLQDKIEEVRIHSENESIHPMILKFILNMVWRNLFWRHTKLLKP